MNEMINASTALIPLLTVHEKNSNYYNASIAVFSFIACVNHILPENLEGMTHFVKLLFSNILFALLDLNPLIGLAVSLVDLTPLFSNNVKVKKIGEKLIQYPRLGIELYLMYQLVMRGFHYDVEVMLICKVIYYFERKDRIERGVRNDFSAYHAAEHVGLYLLFKDYVDVDFDFNKFFYLFLILIFSVAIYMHLINRYLINNMLNRAPNWVLENSELKYILKYKLEQNRKSLKWHNYFGKPWTSHLKLEFVSWKTIEVICDQLLTKLNKDDYDLIVGITTGGSFVAKYIADKLDRPFLCVRSKLWSEISFKQNIIQTYKYFSGHDQMPKLGEVPAEVNGKRILLVDDTIYTGITMNGNKKVLIENGKAKNVETLAMWVKGKNHPNYFHSIKRVPILWEWGSEVD